MFLRKPVKILLAPDSFKGSLSAAEAAEAMAAGIRRAAPETLCVRLPLADGGEGTLDALVTGTGGRCVPVTVTGPLGRPVEAAFGLLGPSGETAVVEMALAAGMLLVPPEQRDPRWTTTYGVGELIEQAALSGARRLIVGLGGSATNDGGAGALQALGVQFFNTGGATAARAVYGRRFGAAGARRCFGPASAWTASPAGFGCDQSAAGTDRGDAPLRAAEGGDNRSRGRTGSGPEAAGLSAAAGYR